MDKKSANDLLELFDIAVGIHSDEIRTSSMQIIERIMIREGYEDAFIRETGQERLNRITQDDVMWSE